MSKLNNQETSLVLTNEKGSDVTTSLIVAKIFEKNHKEVLRDIQRLECSEEFTKRNFALSSYKSENNFRSYPCYEITKDGFSFLVMGYTGKKASEFKELFINEFNRREKAIKSKDAMLSDDDFIITRALSILTDRNKILEEKIKEKDQLLLIQTTSIQENEDKIAIRDNVLRTVLPKVEYCNAVLNSDALIATNVIAKEFGMSAISFNRLLHDKRIIYKSNGTWVLYFMYENLGYTGTKTFVFDQGNGISKTNILTYWTEKGRIFLHSILNKKMTKITKRINIIM
jgi:Rha family phage regulatory protein